MEMFGVQWPAFGISRAIHTSPRMASRGDNLEIRNPKPVCKRVLPICRTFIKLAAIFAFLFGSIEFAYAERIFFAGYKGGFYIKSEEEGGMELRLGGSFQADYRHYLESERNDNRFDIRRARLIFNGSLTRYFRFGLEYEFQGNETKHLVDAYGEAVYGPHCLRMGQFKEPFSLEWQTRDKGAWFAERSMGYWLTPKRDIGAMIHGTFFADSVMYAAGVFNGDGVDGSSGGESDDPEIAGRVVFRPFKTAAWEWLNAFQFGGSASYAAVDLSNVSLEVKSAGMAGSGRNIYVLRQNTKFGVLRDVDDRVRMGLEIAWAKGPLAVAGEWIYLKYNDLLASGESPRDAEFSSRYVFVCYSLTGEDMIFSKGVIKPVYPQRFFNPLQGDWGALILAARFDRFSGDEDWIKKDAFVSVAEADACGAALTWILFPMHRLIFDYTYTDYSSPIRVRVNPDGDVDYVSKENVFTIRLSMDF